MSLSLGFDDRAITHTLGATSFSTLTESHDCWWKKVRFLAPTANRTRSDATGLNCLPVEPKQVVAPTGATHDGWAFSGSLCGISILRAGEAMEGSLRSCARSARIGKILIQRVSQ